MPTEGLVSYFLFLFPPPLTVLWLAGNYGSAALGVYRGIPFPSSM